MIGMATTLAGLALLNPFSIGAGLLFGTKTVRDERRRMLQRRQAEAKQAVRRHIDEVTVPGRQGLPRHAAPHPAPAARPLQRARRGGEHLDRELGAGRAERRQHHDVGAAEPHPRPQGRAGPHRRARRPGPGDWSRAWRAPVVSPSLGSVVRVLVRRTIDTYRDSPQAVGWLQHNLARLRRAAARRDRGEGEGGQVDAAQRARRRGDRADRRGRVHPRRHLVPGRARAEGHDVPRDGGRRGVWRSTATTARCASTCPAFPSSGSTSWRCSGRRRACAPRR